MDVNSVNNSVNHLSSNPNLGLDKAAQGAKVDKVEESDALKLSISAAYNKKRDELSQTLQSLNEGIAVSEISLKGLNAQQNELQNIEDSLFELKGFENTQQKREAAASSIIESLQKFNEIADNTTYKNEKLLTIDDYQEEVSLTISTKDEIYTLNKPETKTVSSNLAQSLKDNALTTPDDITSALLEVNKGKNELNEISENFTQGVESIEKSARNTITEQINLSKENSALRDVDFGAEATDFSRNNVNTQLGYFVGSQANIVQEQSVRLLK